MDNEVSIAIIPLSLRVTVKDYDSMLVNLDQAINDLLNAIKSQHACQISRLITPIIDNSRNLNDLQDISLRFVIWGPIANVAAARKELLRSNLSEVCH